MTKTAALIAVALIAGGCAKEVPVVIETGYPPTAPHQCTADDEPMPKVQHVTQDQSAADVNAMWSSKWVEAKGIARRNSTNHRVCKVYVRRIQKPLNKSSAQGVPHD